MVAHIVEVQFRNVSAAWHGNPPAGDVHEALAPAAHAGLRPLGVVVWHHHVDGEHAFQAFAGGFHIFDGRDGLVVGIRAARLRKAQRILRA